MKEEEKKRIKEQIEILEGVLENLKKLDQTNVKVASQINAISEQITDYRLELEDANQYLTLTTRILITFKSSKIILINVIALILELLNNFTDVFSKSENIYIKSISSIIPALTIYFRVLKG